MFLTSKLGLIPLLKQYLFPAGLKPEIGHTRVEEFQTDASGAVNYRMYVFRTSLKLAGQDILSNNISHIKFYLSCSRKMI